MNWEIEPYQSVGPLTFGQTRNAVREQLGPDYDSFAKDVGENETDAYDNLGVHLYYDDDDRLEFVEAFEPASLTLRGVALHRREYRQVDSELSRLGYDANPTDVGYRYDDIGIALTLDGSTVEGVAVFRRGYYEE